MLAKRRSSHRDSDEVVAVGDAVLDRGRYELRAGDKSFQLPRREFDVLDMLMRRAGRIVTRARLFEEIWGYGWEDSKSLDQHIRRLRRKLEQVEGAPIISTVRGVGYRLEA